MGIFVVLQSILDGLILSAGVIAEVFCVIACLSDICKFVYYTPVVSVQSTQYTVVISSDHIIIVKVHNYPSDCFPTSGVFMVKLHIISGIYIWRDIFHPVAR